MTRSLALVRIAQQWSGIVANGAAVSRWSEVRSEVRSEDPTRSPPGDLARYTCKREEAARLGAVCAILWLFPVRDPLFLVDDALFRSGYPTGIKQLANQTSHQALCEAKKTKKLNLR